MGIKTYTKIRKNGLIYYVHYRALDGFNHAKGEMNQMMFADYVIDPITNTFVKNRDGNKTFEQLMDDKLLHLTEMG